MISFKGIRIHQTGGSDVLRLDSLHFNRIPEDYVLVKNQYSGVNFIDVYHRSGLYPIDLPFTLGMEGGGLIVDAGTNTSGFKEGDKVIFLGAHGSYSEYSLVPIQNVILVPAELDIRTAVAVLLQGLTAEFLVNFIFPLKKGDTCLIHAAAGGVGLLLVQMAKMKGAHVIGTVSNQEKAKHVLNAGADSVVVYVNYNFEDRVRHLTNGNGVNVVYDSVGKATFDQSLNCLRPFGTMVSFGNASGPVAAVSPLELNRKGSLFLTRPSILHYIQDRKNLENSSSKLIGYLKERKLRVNIGLELPLAKAGEAQRVLESRQTYGKIILSMN